MSRFNQGTTPFSWKASARPGAFVAASAFFLSLVACGGGSSSSTPPPPPVPPAYQITSLVADLPTAGATTTDTNLVNPWGLAYGPSTEFWVANQGTATSTVYDGQGMTLAAPLVVSVPIIQGHAMTGPTGMVFNGSGGFMGDHFIVASLEGCICGWGGGTTMSRRVDNSGSQAVYTGLATGSNGTATYLFAANFNNGTVDVFDSTFAPVNLGAAALVDPTLPTGFSPFNAQVIGDKLYVTYAKHDPPALRETHGAGLGYVSAFNLDGTFIQRIASGGSLNAPWGVALAPATFGTYSGALLVGNFGDGTITAFDPATGNQLGQLSDVNGAPLIIHGLWGMAFGNDALAGSSNQLYVTAGPQSETHGLFAAISWTGNSGGGGGGGNGGGGY